MHIAGVAPAQSASGHHQQPSAPCCCELQPSCSACFPRSAHRAQWRLWSSAAAGCSSAGHGSRFGARRKTHLMIVVDADMIIAENCRLDGIHHHSREPQNTLKCSCAFTWCSFRLATSSWRAAWSALRPSSSASLQDHGEVYLPLDLGILAMQPVKKGISLVTGNVRQ